MKQPNYGMFLGFLLIASALTGCAISNEGAVDYRYSSPSGNQPASAAAAPGTVSLTPTFEPRYIKSSDAKNMLVAGDPIAITLKQVFIHDFEEWPTILRIFRGESASGDIAVISNVCETPCVRDHGSAAINNAKVIYFDSDVREGQPLNLSNLHGVYGPITYNGNPLKLDLYIVEMDDEGETIQTMTKNLADIGKTFYPPSHPVSSILSTLAGTFIQQNQSDTALRYSFDLKTEHEVGAIANPHSAFLQTGNYIFIRSEVRDKIIPWDSLAYDESTGRVFMKGCAKGLQPGSECFYQENTYIVIEISKPDSSVAADSQQLTYSALKASEKATKASGFTTQITAADLSAASISLKSLELKSDSVGNLGKIQGTLPNTPERNTAVLRFVSGWFDASRTIEDSDKKYIIDRSDKILGNCTNISPTTALGFQSAIVDRTFPSGLTKDTFISGLIACTPKT